MISTVITLTVAFAAASPSFSASKKEQDTASQPVAKPGDACAKGGKDYQTYSCCMQRGAALGASGPNASQMCISRGFTK